MEYQQITLSLSVANEQGEEFFLLRHQIRPRGPRHLTARKVLSAVDVLTNSFRTPGENPLKYWQKIINIMMSEQKKAEVSRR